MRIQALLLLALAARLGSGKATGTASVNSTLGRPNVGRLSARVQSEIDRDWRLSRDVSQRTEGSSGNLSESERRSLEGASPSSSLFRLAWACCRFLICENLNSNKLRNDDDGADEDNNNNRRGPKTTCSPRRRRVASRSS